MPVRFTARLGACGSFLRRRARPLRIGARLLCLGPSLTLPASAGEAIPPTLDGGPPLVIAHRGLSGLAPEETAPAYVLAAALGADALELDLHLTKDCVPVARHNPWLSDNTDVVAVAGADPEVARRRRTRPGSFVVDGEDHAGDWSIADFTLAELKRWLGGTTSESASERPSLFDGRFPILTFQEVIDIARTEGRRVGRPLIVYPETKNPSWNNAGARANGCPGERPLEDAVIAVAAANGLNARAAPILVQSFEPGSLRYMAAHGLRARLVQLIGAAGLDLAAGTPRYDGRGGRPFDWTQAGDPRRFDAMLTPEGLAEIRTYADGIGPWKPQILPLRVAPGPDGDPGGGGVPQARVQPPTRLVADAHRAGLFVHVYTFRNEARFLAADYGGDPAPEYRAFFRLGVDGVFTDFAHTAVAAWAQYRRSLAAP